jgi:Mn2+/Fe2+ NRAMP family transporter
MIVFSLADLGTIAAEFAGVASGMGLFGVSKYVSVPIAAVLVWAVIVYGSYRPVERLLLVFSLVYLA